MLMTVVKRPLISCLQIQSERFPGLVVRDPSVRDEQLKSVARLKSSCRWPIFTGQGRKLLKANIISGGFMWNPRKQAEFLHLPIWCSRQRSYRRHGYSRSGCVNPDFETHNIIVNQLSRSTKIMLMNLQQWASELACWKSSACLIRAFFV